MKSWKNLASALVAPLVVAGVFLAVSYKKHRDNIKSGLRWE